MTKVAPVSVTFYRPFPSRKSKAILELLKASGIEFTTVLKASDSRLEIVCECCKRSSRGFEEIKLFIGKHSVNTKLKEP